MFARQGLQPLRSIRSVSLIPRMTASRLPLHATHTRAMGTDAKSPPPTPAKVDAYLESKLVPRGQWADEPGLQVSRARALQEGIPEIAVSAMQGHFLTVLARGMGATKILEIGTLWGYSTYFLTRALPPHGQIDTLEVNPLHAQVAQETFLNCDLYPFPSIHLGPALSTLKKLAPPGAQDGLQGDEVGYDLVFIDADKASVKEYFLQSLRLTRKGGVIIVDNAVRRGRILPEVEADEQDKGLRRLYEWVEQDAGKTVLMSGIQTVGAKSWDGFAIATKL